MEYNDPQQGPTFRFTKEGMEIDTSTVTEGWNRQRQNRPVEFSWERLEEYRTNILARQKVE